jgi:hypothetical protein
MSPLARGVVAIGVALLVVLGAAALAYRGVDAPIGAATPTPTPTPAVSPGPDATPTPEPEEPLDAFAQIEEQVIALRELPAAGIGPPDILTRDELAAELREMFDEDYPPDEREADNLTLRSMGLLDEDQDIGELQLQLLEGQVLGFYDDTDQRMVVVTDRGLDAEAKITYAHEYTHALQDAAFGLDAFELDAVGEDDRVMATLALIEGDATVVMLLWAFQHLTPEEMQDALSITPPDTAGIPDWLVQALTWPYEAGTEFVLALMGGDPTQPDWDAVDRAFADPPVSTAQILRPELYFDGVQPVEIEPHDLAAELDEALGGDWREVESTPIGEAFVGIWLEALGVRAVEAGNAAAGWAGDRLTVASGDDDEWVLSWRLAWDTAADADEFAVAYESVSERLPFAAELVRVTETQLLVRHASSPALLGALAPAD